MSEDAEAEAFTLAASLAFTEAIAEARRLRGGGFTRESAKAFGDYCGRRFAEAGMTLHEAMYYGGRILGAVMAEPQA